ncbi:MAG: TonB-dependent receptor [Tannerellaceae bacterium]|nr:TonB-dependent receptor [Tannerellaceae bacterium]
MKDLKANWDQKDEEGNYTHYNWQHAYATNPYWVVNKNLNGYTRDRMFGKTSLWYKPTDWLKFEGRLGLDHFNSDQHSTVLWSVDYPDGFFRDYIRKLTEFNADFIAYFNKNVEDFNISAIAGGNYRNLASYEKRMGGQELVVPGLYTISNAKGSPYVYAQNLNRRSNSVYANVSLGWKNQLYADISARNDWDSTIEESFFYPSFSASWIPTETFEGFGEAIALNFLKLRGGWAKIGSATDAYKIGRYYDAYIGGSFNGNVLYSNPQTYPPLALRPEMVKTWEVGVEANFLNNRLHLDAAYYQRTTTDQIMEANLANSTGYTSMLLNAGKVKNKGVELQISADIIKNAKGFNWTATLNWSKDKSKIIELYEDPVTGQTLDAYEIYHDWSVYNYAKPGKSWGTLVGTGFVYNEDGSILTEDGMPVYESNREIGDVTPNWLAGFRNEFSYKEWTFGFLLDYRNGGDIFSVSQMFGAYTGIYDFTAAGGIRENGMVLGRDFMSDKVFKTADGQVNDVVVSPQDFFENFYSIGELAIVDGSFLKLREVYLTYTFPRSVLERTKYIKGLRVSLIGSNLALLWTHKSNLINLDPETTSSADNRGIGFESNSYPPTRSMGLKLHVTF